MSDKLIELIKFASDSEAVRAFDEQSHAPLSDYKWNEIVKQSSDIGKLQIRVPGYPDIGADYRAAAARGEIHLDQLNELEAELDHLEETGDEEST